MRFLIVNTDYGEFLSWLYSQRPELGAASYEEQMQARQETLFGLADFYSRNLRKLGHEARGIYANNEFLQAAWAREHGRSRSISRSLNTRLSGRFLDRASKALPLQAGQGLHGGARLVRESLRQRRLRDVLVAQVKHYAPDVLLNQAMDVIAPQVMRKVKPLVRLLVGQIASPLPVEKDFRGYDLVISSLPNFVEYFRRRGIASEVSRLAFEPSVLSRLNGDNGEVAASFVGSLFRDHTARIRLLEELCEEVDLEIWGTGVGGLRLDSPIRQRYRGTAWGLDMYRILQASRVTINQHVDVAGPYANNLRLYEATGVGTLLITDWKENLSEMFEPGREVIAYRNAAECISAIHHYLENEDERQKVARAGHTRTLKDHTYERRIGELIQTVERYLS